MKLIRTDWVVFSIFIRFTYQVLHQPQLVQEVLKEEHGVIQVKVIVKQDVTESGVLQKHALSVGNKPHGQHILAMHPVAKAIQHMIQQLILQNVLNTVHVIMSVILPTLVIKH